MGFEYARFGTSFVRRTAGSDEDWMGCERELVPDDFFREEARTDIRRRTAALGGSDPFFHDELPEGATVVTKEGVSAVRLANPEADAIAGELGLTPDELRERLTSAPGGTRNRVSEERFDEIAARLGVDPKTARDRFADRSAEPVDTTDELASR